MELSVSIFVFVNLQSNVCNEAYTVLFLAEPLLSAENLKSQTSNVFSSRISGSSKAKLELPGV